MSKAEEFRQYAEEAVCWSINPRPNKEKQAFMDLARTWTQAAVLSELDRCCCRFHPDAAPTAQAYGIVFSV